MVVRSIFSAIFNAITVPFLMTFIKKCDTFLDVRKFMNLGKESEILALKNNWRNEGGDYKLQTGLSVCYSPMMF